MATNAIASGPAGYVRKITASSRSSQSAAMQEASETLAVTQKGPAHGDMQAVCKLAQEQQAQGMKPSPRVGTRITVDHLT